MAYNEKEPTWLILKKAATELVELGRISFSRRELINYAKKHVDPEKPESSLDFEVDLVTVNGSSKDKYKDPEKLFLFRIGRGRYTLYDPELHGPLEKYLEISSGIPTRRYVLRNVADSLKSRGYSIHEVKPTGKAIVPDLIATSDGEKIGVWVIDPASDQKTQLRTLAYSIGSAIITRPQYNWVMIIVPPDIVGVIPQGMRNVLEKNGIHIALIKEERRYTVKL